MLTVTSLSTGITSLLFFMAFFKVYKKWKKTNLLPIKYLGIFLLSFGLQQFGFFAATGAITLVSIVNNYIWALAHVFMFIGISYFIKLPLQMRFPNKTKAIFRFAIAYSVIGIGIIFWKVPEVISYVTSEGVYLFKVPPLAGATIGLFTTIALLFSLWVFLCEGRETSSNFFKVRLYMMSVGTLIFLIAGPIHNFITTPFLTIFADLLIIVGAVLLTIGIYSATLSKEVNIF